VDLAQKGFISDTALSSSLSSVASAQAQLKAAESLSVALQKQIAEAVVTAPFDGVVSKRSALVGEKLSVEQEILSLVNPHKLELKAEVDAAAGQHLKPGQALRVKLEGLDQEVPAVIVRLSPGNDTGSRGLPDFLR
jgi:multidrug resistance efflux pump